MADPEDDAVKLSPDAHRQWLTALNRVIAEVGRATALQLVRETGQMLHRGIKRDGEPDDKTIRYHLLDDLEPDATHHVSGAIN